LAFEVGEEELDDGDADDKGGEVAEDEGPEVRLPVGAVGAGEKAFGDDAHEKGDAGEEGVFGGVMGVEPEQAAGDDGGAGAGDSGDEGDGLAEADNEGLGLGDFGEGEWFDFELLDDWV